MKKEAIDFLKSTTKSWHFRVFVFNLLLLLMLSSTNFWLFLGQLPNSGDSILYIVHVHSLKESFLTYLMIPGIDMWQYAGVPVIGAGPLLPFVPLVVAALATGEVFAYKFLTIVLVAAAGGTMCYYAYSLSRSRIVSLVAATVYVWNPPMLITAISEGHFDLVWFYALIPLLFVTTMHAIKRASLLSLGIAGAIMGLVLFGHAQALLIIGPFYLIYSLLLGILLPCLRATKRLKIFFTALSKKVVTLAIVISIGFLLASARLFPLIFEAQYRYSDLSLGDPNSMLGIWSAQNLSYALMLRVPSGHGDPYFFDPTVAGPLFYAFALAVPVLAMVAVILKFRDDTTVVSFVLGLLAAFFAAGPNAPQYFQPFIWFFQNIPFYSEMRTPGRFAIVTAFFLAYPCGVAVKKISDVVSARIPGTRGNRKRRGARYSSGKRQAHKVNPSKRTAAKIVISGSLCIILILNAAPALTQSFTTYDIPTQLTSSYQFISQQQGNYRLLGLPVATYIPDNVYGLSTNPDCYAPVLTGKANLFGDGSGASNYLVNFLYYYLDSLIGCNVSHSIGKLIGLYNTRWMVLHRPLLNNQSINNLLQDPTLTTVYTSPDNSENVLQSVEEAYPFIYSANNMLVFGGPESILALAGLDEFHLNSSTKWAFTLASQLYPLRLTSSMISTYDAIAFREANLTSVAALRCGLSAAGLLVSAGTVNDGWAKNDFGRLYGRWIPQYFVGDIEELERSATSLFGSYIRTTGSADLGFNINVDSEGQYELWIRAWSSQNNGNLSLTLDKLTPSSYAVNLSKGGWESGWHWLNGGTLNLTSGVHRMTLRSEGENSIDAVMVIPKDILGNFATSIGNIVDAQKMGFLQVLDASNLFCPANHSWTISLALGGNTSTGRCFSTFVDGARASAEVFFAVSGNYSLSMRLLQRAQRGNITFYVDGIRQLDLNPQGPDQWVTRTINASIYISQGYHNLTILNTGTLGNDIDKIIIAHKENENGSTNVYSGQANGQVDEFTETGPGIYKVSLELAKPSLVVLNAAFHPGWRANDGKSEYDPVPINYLVNGFFINNTGKFTLIIVFGSTPSRIVGEYLSTVGLVTTAIMIAFGRYGKKRRSG